MHLNISITDGIYGGLSNGDVFEKINRLSTQNNDINYYDELKMLNEKLTKLISNYMK